MLSVPSSDYNSWKNHPHFWMYFQPIFTWLPTLHITGMLCARPLMARCWTSWKYLTLNFTKLDQVRNFFVCLFFSWNSLLSGLLWPHSPDFMHLVFSLSPRPKWPPSILMALNPTFTSTMPRFPYSDLKYNSLGKTKLVSKIDTWLFSGYELPIKTYFDQVIPLLKNHPFNTG